MSRIFNFSAGPAMLPEAVMRQAQEEFMDWHGTGMSVMELSHRSKEFISVAQEAECDLRELLSIPDHYHVLFLAGGAQGQNSAIVMNLLGDFKKAAYVQTGVWGKIAIDEAKRYCDLEVVACSEDRNYTYIPNQCDWKPSDDSAYLHYVDNETVNGVEFFEPPKDINVPLVCDMSSSILSRPINVNDFGLIYACAQKNLGAAGVTLVIVRDDLLKRKAMPTLPRILNYRLQAEKGSMVNTPPTYPWYMVGLVAKWVKAEGGLQEMDRRAKQRSKMLYDYIDQSHFYSNSVDPTVRSRMNVVFNLKNESLNERFVTEALKANISGIRGHRLLGGMRASMYNAMPIEGAKALLTFMKDFAKSFN